jgi:putative IMPACT (imprinted ancient) family translation regulator
VRARFEDLGAVHAALAGFGAEKLGEHFDAGGVRLRLALPADRADALRAHLRDATRDRAQVQAATGG